MKVIPVYLIVRGYMWGAMVHWYESGKRTFSGSTLPDGLLRYQRLPEPIFTPVKQDEHGHHQEVSYDDFVGIVGNQMAQHLKATSVALFKRGFGLASQRNLLLVDSGYQFGVDENNTLHLINEVHTPDTSRLIRKEEYESKWPRIEQLMATAKYKTMDELLAAVPDLKIKEYSKQYVTEALDLEHPEHRRTCLTEDQVIECAFRYINAYERITGFKFAFPDSYRLSIRPLKRILAHLTGKKLLKGGCVVLVSESADEKAAQRYKSMLLEDDVPAVVAVVKGEAEAVEELKHWNLALEPIVLAVVSESLYAPIAQRSVNPSVMTTERDVAPRPIPDQLRDATIVRPQKLAHFALQLFSMNNEDYRGKLLNAQLGVAAAIDSFLQLNKE